MLYPLSISLQGFRSFRKPSTLILPDKEGLFNLTGINRRHPDLGRNGVGKSSLWDALSWAFYGKTSRGLKGARVANWRGDSVTQVQVRFRIKKRVYELTRTHDPGSLALASEGSNPRTITQEALEELVGYTHEGFLACVLMGQFNEFFFDLGPTDKLNAFSSALKLQSWLEAAKRASSGVREAIETRHELDKELAATQTIATLREELNYLAKQSAEHRRSFKERYDEAGQVLHKLEEFQIPKAEAAYQDILTQSKTEVSHHTEVEKRIQEIVATVSALREVFARLDVQCEQGAKDFVVLTGQIKDARKMQGNCPTCRQPLTPKCIDDLVGTLKLRREFVAGENQTMDEKRYRIRRKWKKARIRARTARQEKEVADKKLARFSRQVQEAKELRDALVAQAGQARHIVDTYSKMVDPFEERRAKILRDIKRLKKQRVELREQLKETDRLESAAKFWSAGFKEVRLWVVEEALTQLTIEVNNCLAQLGLDGWEITFDVERETQSGTIAKGFTVNVKSWESRTPQPWEVWCGGETQRLRIAGAIGLANMVRERTGVEWFTEVWDEPTMHLSDAGVLDLTGFLAERAMVEGRQIWLVDHRSLDRGNFTDVFSVILEKEGARVVHKR